MPTADELNRTGADLHLKGDLDGAKAHYLAALLVDPGFLPALSNLGAVVGRLGNKDVAISMLKKLTAIAPQDGNGWNNLGTFLMQVERFDEARVAMDRAKILMSDNPAVWHNLALLALRRGTAAEALECLANVEALGGWSSQIENDKAHVLLAMGDLKSALESYEARWELMLHLEPWDYYIPEWQGQDLVGKRILLHAEQGFGDTIMTSRFVENVKALGAKVTLGLPGSLCRLFEHQPWVESVLNIETMTEADAKFDFHSPLYSTMRWLGLKSPADIDPRPFLVAPEMTGPPVIKNAFNVGICWASGSRGGELDWRRRVSPLKDWLVFAEIPTVQLWSLQKGREANEISELGAETLVHDHTNEFSDWAETAVFIDKLDLVISVDTAVAHLAAAMGKSTWMVSQFSNCWRWWDIANKTGKPWYESMSIIKQPTPNDWATPLKTLVKSLEQMAAESYLEKRKAA